MIRRVRGATPHKTPGRERSYRASGAHAGFTLLEVVIVVVVLGIALAVALPSLQRGTASLELRAAGRDLLNCLRYAREKAITEGEGSRVVITRETNSAVLTDAYGEGGRRLVLPSSVRIQRLAAGGVDLLEGPLLVRFLPNGSTETAEIVLESKTGATLKVVTDPITGGARVITAAEGAAR